MKFLFTRLIFNSIFVLILCGCTGMEVNSLSRPVSTVKNGISRDGKISNSGIDIYVRPANKTLDGSGASYLVVIDDIKKYKESIFNSEYYELTSRKSLPTVSFVEMLVKSNRDITIDVSKLSLVVDNEEFLSSYSMGPLPERSIRNYALSLCDPIPGKTHSSTVLSISKNESVCFALAFKITPPMPSQSIQFNLQNLIVDGQANIFPRVDFEYSQETRAKP